MNPAHHPGPLPRYSIRDEEKTRPCVVVFDWSSEEDATVIRVTPIEPAAAVPPPLPPRAPLAKLDDDIEELVDVEELEDIEELDEFDVQTFRPRWHGIGRRPGAVALAVVLVASLTIGAFAMFGSSEARAGAADVDTPLEATGIGSAAWGY